MSYYTMRAEKRFAANGGREEEQVYAMIGAGSKKGVICAMTRVKTRCFAILAVGLALLACDAPAFGGWTDTLTEGLSAGWDAVTGFFSKPEEPDREAVSGDSLPDYLAGGWEKLTDSLSEALSLRDEGEKLPESAWFGSDKSSNAKKINKLLDAALEILSRGQAGTTRQEVSELRERLAKVRAEADKLRNQRLTAPESSMLPWKKTRTKVDEELAALDRELAEGTSALTALNAKLADELRQMGLDLDQPQVDVLLSSVTGDDLLENAVVFANVRIVVEKLESLARNAPNDLESSRRYTGMYLILNDLLIYTQEGLAQKIGEEYRPRLGSIAKEAEALRADALNKSRQKIYTAAQRESFSRNAESNAMTIRVASLYTELLDSQRKWILDNLQDLRRNRDLAENTYRTVRSSGDLRNLIHSGLTLFDSIHALTMPQLQIFESEAMRREFEEINRRLKR